MRHLRVTCQGRWFSEKPAAKKTFRVLNKSKSVLGFKASGVYWSICEFDLEKTPHNSRFAKLFSRNPRTSGDRNLSKKNLFFPVFTGRFAILTYGKTQNCKRFPTNIVQSIMLFVLCALLADLTDFEFQKLL